MPYNWNGIQNEWSGSNPISLSEYYGCAFGVSTTGAIAASQFLKSSVQYYIGTQTHSGTATNSASTVRVNINNTGTMTTTGATSNFNGAWANLQSYLNGKIDSRWQWKWLYISGSTPNHTNATQNVWTAVTTNGYVGFSVFDGILNGVIDVSVRNVTTGSNATTQFSLSAWSQVS